MLDFDDDSVLFCLRRKLKLERRSGLCLLLGDSGISALDVEAGGMLFDGGCDADMVESEESERESEEVAVYLRGCWQGRFGDWRLAAAGSPWDSVLRVFLVD